MNGQKVKVGKGRVHSRVKAKPQGTSRADKLIDIYVNQPREARQALAEEWIKLVAAGVPLSAIAEEYNTSICSVSIATNDPEEWMRRGTGRNAGYGGNKGDRMAAGQKAARTRKRRRGKYGSPLYKRLAAKK
ncbi:MAG: hypothetical protein ACYTAO_20120 [Planctomycetota bacterium]|jgi:hypothetical protein